MIPPYSPVTRPHTPRKEEPLVTISIGPQPSVSIRTPTSGISPNININDDQTRPKPIQAGHTPVHNKGPYNYWNPRNSETLPPQTRPELLKRLGYPETPFKRNIGRNLLPPTLYDATPPTLYDRLYPRVREEKFAPPRLQDYLPPTLFDPLSYTEPQAGTSLKKEEPRTGPNPFMKYRSVKDNKQYYREQLLPQPSPPPSQPEKLSVLSHVETERPLALLHVETEKPPAIHPAEVEKLTSLLHVEGEKLSGLLNSEAEETVGLSAGVGNKNGPVPSKVYKAQLKFPPKQLLLPKKPPAIKFEIVNKTKPAIKFANSEEVYPVIYYSDRKSINPDEYLRSKLIDKDKVFRYKSKIRYRNNLPVQSGPVYYPGPSGVPGGDPVSQTTLRNVDSNGFITVLDKDRLYRNDFPKLSEMENYNVTKRQIAPSQMPCHSASKCVLVKESSSIRPAQDVIHSSQVSTLPLPTQLPRPPLSSKLPYLPFASYRTTPPARNELVKSLPTFRPSSVRSGPQYPYHKSYVLAKLKRKDIPK